MNNTTIELTIPRGYSEMDEKQTKMAALLILKGYSEEDIRVRCFVRFAGIKPLFSNDDRYHFRKKGIKGNFSMELGELNYSCKKLSFLTQHYIGIKPLKKIGRMIPCDNLLRNTSFVQYLDAENFYQAFIHTKEEKYLIAIIATLYGKKQEEYSNENTAKKTKYFGHKANALQRLITLMWFIGVKEYFTKKFPYLFESSGGATTAPNMYEIMQQQVRSLTDGDITKQKQVLSSKTWDALGELNAKAKEVKEMKRKYPKMFN